MTVKSFTRGRLEELGVPYKAMIQFNIVDQDRWATFYEGVFLDSENGKHYRIPWVQGSTENQDDTDPFGYAEVVRATEVEHRPVTELQWVTV